MREPYNSVAQPHGRGVTERQLAAHSGLRNFSTTMLWGPAPSVIASGSPIGGAAREDVPNANDIAGGVPWRDLSTRGLGPLGNPIANGAFLYPAKLPIPSTPSITIFRGTNATPFRVRFRIQGTDQFGAKQVEETPWIDGDPAAAALVHVIFASKVFSWVTRVGYQSVGLRWDGTAPTGTGAQEQDICYVGSGFGFWAPDSVTADYYKFYSIENNGIGLPYRVIGPGAKQDSELEPEIDGVAIRNITDMDAVGGSQFDSFAPYNGSNTGFEVGYSVPGWQGTPHKLSIRSDDFSTYAGDVGFRGLSPLPDAPAGLVQVLSDVALITVSGRTGIGTQMDGNPSFTNVYQKA